MNYHFIVPPEFETEIRSLTDKIVGKDFPYWLTGPFMWAAQSYLVLRQYRSGMTIGTAARPDTINFAHVMTFRQLGPRRGEFRLCARADYPRLFDVDFELLQNPAVPVKPWQAYLPLWPVPGIIPRDTTRREVRTIAYSGRLGPRNLASQLRNGLQLPSQFEWRIVPPSLWHDLSEVDVLVAIRSFDRDPHVGKPPSKLFSAWIAGIPLVAGYDSAYSAIGLPGVDYIRVSAPDQLLGELSRLVSDPRYYHSFVHAGNAKAPGISHDAIAKLWLSCFDQRVAPAFEAWKARGGPKLGPVAGRVMDVSRNAASKAKSVLVSGLAQITER